jgi:hypothetical protein
MIKVLFENFPLTTQFFVVLFGNGHSGLLKFKIFPLQRTGLRAGIVKFPQLRH